MNNYEIEATWGDDKAYQMSEQFTAECGSVEEVLDELEQHESKLFTDLWSTETVGHYYKETSSGSFVDVKIHLVEPEPVED